MMGKPAEKIAAGENLHYFCIVNNKHPHTKHTKMKTMSKTKAGRFLLRAARIFVASFQQVSKNTNHPLYCSRFYNPYVM